MSRPRLYSREEAAARVKASHVLYSDRARQARRAAKLEAGCAGCGYTENADALQFDHIKPINHPERSRPRRDRIETLQDLEQALADPNIQVLCANCHSIKTVNERTRSGN